MKCFVLRRLILACLLGAFISLFLSSCSDSDSGDVPATAVKSSDWLLVLYLDGDSDLNDIGWANLVEAELALAELKTRAAGGEAVPSISVVVLWDGLNKDKDEASRKKFATTTRLHPDGAIFELGPSDGYRASDKNWYLSSNTIELTSTAADWLPKEPNMNDASTLANFLTWVKKRYAAKNVVLGISNHGSGTDYETTSGGANRSICSDEDTTKGSGMLTTTDIKQALNSSGFRPHVIWMDSCLQASCEIAYELRGYADSLVSSASISLANNYNLIIDNISKTNTYADFVLYVVSSYRWENFKIANPRTDTLAWENCASAYKAMSQVGIDLNVAKQEALHSAVENLASSLLTNERDRLKAIYDSYLFQDANNESNCKGWVYSGSFAFLADLGYFCYQLYNDGSLANVGVSDATITKAVELDEALAAVIRSSWVGKRKTGENEKSLYRWNVLWTNNLPEAVEFGDGATDPNKKNWVFGPTIAIKAYGTDDKAGSRIDTDYNAVTGYSSKWGELLKAWHSNK